MNRQEGNNVVDENNDDGVVDNGDQLISRRLWNACTHQGVIYSYHIANLAPGDNQLLIRAEEIHPGTPSMLIYKMTVTYQVP